MDTLISLGLGAALVILGLLIQRRGLLKPIRSLWLRIKYKRIDKVCIRCGGRGEYEVDGDMGIMCFDCPACENGVSDAIFQHRHPIFSRYQSRERWNKDVNELDEMMEAKR